MEEIPEFYLEGEDAASIHNNIEFHSRVVSLISSYINGTSDITTLCYIYTIHGDVMTAELPPESFEQTIQKSLEFFIESEDYEMCNTIKNLIKKI